MKRDPIDRFLVAADAGSSADPMLARTVAAWIRAHRPRPPGRPPRVTAEDTERTFKVAIFMERMRRPGRGWKGLAEKRAAAEFGISESTARNYYRDAGALARLLVRAERWARATHATIHQARRLAKLRGVPEPDPHTTSLRDYRRWARGLVADLHTAPFHKK